MTSRAREEFKQESSLVAVIVKKKKSQFLQTFISVGLERFLERRLDRREKLKLSLEAH